MEHWYHIYFEGKTEYAEVEDTLTQHQIGRLLFSFLDIDWDGLVSKVSEFKALYPDGRSIEQYYIELSAHFMDAHPFLTHMIGRLTPEAKPDALKELYIRLSDLARFRAEIGKVISATLDMDGEYNELTPIKRYYLLQLSRPELCIQAQTMYDLVSIQHRISKNGKRVFSIATHEITREFIDEVADSELSAYPFYCADDTRALVFLEFEHLCTEGYAARRCGHCGRYFLPYSVASLYCDRPVNGSEKTCKDVAAKAKYVQKVNADAAKKLYTRLNNAYQMRCARAPAVYHTEDRFAWQDKARRLLDEVEAGAMTVEDFEEAVRLPDAK